MLKTIRDIAQVKNGFAFKSEEYKDHGIRVIRITNVQKGKIVDSDPKFIDSQRTNEFSEYALTEGDILISLTGNVGRVGVLTKELEPAILNQRVGCIRVKRDDVNSRYLFQLLNSNKFEAEAIKNSKGIAQLNLSSKWIENFKVPIPSIEEQERIASILDKVDALRQKRKESIRLLDGFLKATFWDMFGDPVKNEKGWEKKSIKEIADIRIGPFGSLLHAEDYIENGIPLINPSHIINGEIVPDQSLTITPMKFKDLEPYQLKMNDVVVARRGEIGRCAVVRLSTPLFCGTGSMFIRIKTDYPPILLQYQIYNTSLKEYLESQAKGVTMKNLNSGTVSELKVLAPPIALQTKFAEIVYKIEKQKEEMSNSQTELDNLFNALMQKYFG